MRPKPFTGCSEVDPKGGGFKRGDDNPLDCDLLVVDETSMVDVMLMQALMKAVPDKSALLIVGKPMQTTRVWAFASSSSAVPEAETPLPDGLVRHTQVLRLLNEFRGLAF